MNKIPLFKVFMSENVHKEVKKVLYSGFVGQGSQVDKFEHSLKNYNISLILQSILGLHCQSQNIAMICKERLVAYRDVL